MTDLISRYDTERLSDGIGLPEGFREAVRPVCREILHHRFAMFEAIGNNMRDPEAYVPLESALRDECGFEPELTRMAIYMLLACDAEKTYRDRGRSLRIYLDSMREITIWSKAYNRETGRIGIHDQLDWLTRFFQNSLVRLNRLEFEKISFPLPYEAEVHGISIKPGDEVINIHIPEDGPLLPDLVADSFRRAYRYFGCEGEAVFFCSTWIIWPQNREFMREGSNILKFLDNFKIVGHEEARYHRDLWRIFGKLDSFEPSGLPRNTDLQRRFADYLAEHDSVSGRGYGVFAHNGKEVLK